MSKQSQRKTRTSTSLRKYNAEALSVNNTPRENSAILARHTAEFLARGGVVQELKAAKPPAKSKLRPSSFVRADVRSEIRRLDNNQLRRVLVEQEIETDHKDTITVKRFLGSNFFEVEVEFVSVSAAAVVRNYLVTFANRLNMNGRLEVRSAYPTLAAGCDND